MVYVVAEAARNRRDTGDLDVFGDLGSVDVGETMTDDNEYRSRYCLAILAAVIVAGQIALFAEILHSKDDSQNRQKTTKRIQPQRQK